MQHVARRSAVTEFQVRTATGYQWPVGKPIGGYGPRQKAPRRPNLRPEDASPPVHEHVQAGAPLPDGYRAVVPLRLVEWSTGWFHWECICGWEGGDFRCTPKRWDVSGLQRATEAAEREAGLRDEPVPLRDPQRIAAALWMALGKAKAGAYVSA